VELNIPSMSVTATMTSSTVIISTTVTNNVRIDGDRIPSVFNQLEIFIADNAAVVFFVILGLTLFSTIVCCCAIKYCCQRLYRGYTGQKKKKVQQRRQQQQQQRESDEMKNTVEQEEGERKKKKESASLTTRTAGKGDLNREKEIEVMEMKEILSVSSPPPPPPPPTPSSLNKMSREDVHENEQKHAEAMAVNVKTSGDMALFSTVDEKKKKMSIPQGIVDDMMEEMKKKREAKKSSLGITYANIAEVAVDSAIVTTSQQIPSSSKQYYRSQVRVVNSPRPVGKPPLPPKKSSHLRSFSLGGELPMTEINEVQRSVSFFDKDDGECKRNLLREELMGGRKNIRKTRWGVASGVSDSNSTGEEMV